MEADAIIEWIPRLRRYARALTGDASAADDLVQDTLARAIEKFSLWRPGTNLRAWLFSIMHNVFVNQVRARKLDIDAGFDDEALSRVAGRATHEGEMIDLVRCLKRLPHDQKEVLLLVGLEEMSYQEAADSLGIPVGTVMSRLSRGRQKMHELLAGAPDVATPLRVVK